MKVERGTGVTVLKVNRKGSWLLCQRGSPDCRLEGRSTQWHLPDTHGKPLVAVLDPRP